jgi:hypothetical protein
MVRDSTSPQSQSAADSLSFQCDPGVLSFTTQPRSGVLVGEVVAEDLVVRAEDTNGDPLEGVFVTLGLNSSCNNGYEGPTIATDAAGDAHFLNVTLSRGCYDNAFGATAPAFAPTLSNLFDIFGFGDVRFGMDRVGHTATLLPDGKILVAGGADSGGGFPLSAVLYDPVARSSRFATGNMVEARMFHTATLLPSGQVLLAGGHRGTPHTISSLVPSAELYDPLTETFTSVGDLRNSRTFHTATLYSDGTVFLVGGRGIDGVLPTVEIYDPVAPIPFTDGPVLNFARMNHTATRVNDLIVIIGGTVALGNQNGIEQIEIIDSASTLIPGGLLTVPRTNHTATLRSDGNTILVAGGFANSTVEDRMEHYSTSDRSSIELPNRLSPGVANHVAVRLESGEVVLAGHSDDRGNYGSAVQVISRSGTVASYGFLLSPRSKMRAVYMTDGPLENQVIIIGGEQSSSASSNIIETFFPSR